MTDLAPVTYNVTTGALSYDNGAGLVSIPYTGPAGPIGSTGPAGQGVPTGGTTEQILSKIDGTDYNTHWVAKPSGGASGLGTIASATTCDIGSASEAVLVVTGTTAIGSFGTSLAAGVTKKLIIQSRGLQIVVGTNLTMNIGRVASYWSAPGDIIECINIGTSGGSPIIHGTLVRADGIGSTSAANSASHTGTGIAYSGVQSANVYSAEMRLLKVMLGDMNQTGLWPSHPLRLTNVGTASSQITVSLAHNGANGLDTGTVQPNTDYYLWCISNGVDYQLNWTASTTGPTVLPSGWDQGEIYATMLYWNRTDASSHLKNIIKFDKKNFYPWSAAPIVASGTYASPTYINLGGYMAPGSGAYQTFCVQGGNTGKFTHVSADTTGIEFYMKGNGNQYNLSTGPILGYMGGVYVHSDDPGFIMKLHSWDDIF